MPPPGGRQDSRLSDPKVQIAIAMLRQGVEAYGGVKLLPHAEFGVQAEAPWSTRSVRDVAVKGVFKLKFW